jgi:nucleotide-binding universal stress UspA family protein
MVDDGVTLITSNQDKESVKKQLMQLALACPGVPIEHRVEEGDAARTILRIAGEINADLIVMGTHGRTGLSRLLMGSVAEQVVRKAPCAVLTVKSPFPAEQHSNEPPAESAARG